MPASGRWLPLVGLLLGTACGGTSFQEIGGPSEPRCQLTVAAPPASIPASGTAFTLDVSTSRDCVWAANSETSWLTVSPASGQGSAALNATVAANALGSVRSSVLSVNDLRVNITQQGIACRFELGDQGATIGPSGANTIVLLRTVAGCEWRASSPVSWVRVLRGSGTGPATIGLDIDANSGGDRVTTLSIAGVPFIVNQSSNAPPAPPSPPRSAF